MGHAVKWLSYEFAICQYEGQWNDVGGICIFAGLDQSGQWIPYYVGQCDNFRTRIPSHEQWDKAQSLGATHVHAMTVLQPAERDKIERLLIQTFDPILNSPLP